MTHAIRCDRHGEAAGLLAVLLILLYAPLEVWQTELPVPGIVIVLALIGPPACYAMVAGLLCSQSELKAAGKLRRMAFAEFWQQEHPTWGAQAGVAVSIVVTLAIAVTSILVKNQMLSVTSMLVTSGLIGLLGRWWIWRERGAEPMLRRLLQERTRNEAHSD